MDELSKRNLDTRQFKKKYPRQYKLVIEKYGGKDNIFDIMAAILLYLRNYDRPVCNICGENLTITKKYRKSSFTNRCSKHRNTNNIISIDDIQKSNIHDYEIVKIPEKFLTKSDDIVVRCKSHGEYTVKIVNFLSGMKCQKCYFEDMIGHRGVVHTDETKRKISSLKKGKRVNLSDDARQRKSEKQRDAWRRRKQNKKEFDEYIKQASERRRAFLRKNGVTFPNKSQTKLESDFEKFLLENNIQYVHQHKIEGKRFDFFIPQMNLLVEVDGEYWHRFESSIKNDIEKHLLCDQYNIELLRISSDDFMPELIFESSSIRKRHTKNIMKNRGIDGF